MNHQKVARTERAVEPIEVAEAGGKIGQTIADAIFEEGQPFSSPRLVTLREQRVLAFKDGRLHGIERRKHPRYRARPGVRIVGQEAAVALGNVKDDRAGLE